MLKSKVFVPKNNIWYYRQLHRMTVKQLADFIDVPKKIMWKIEQGYIIPSVEVAARLCFALGLNFSDLFLFEFHRSDGDIVIYKF